MNLYDFQRGEPVEIGLEVVSGDPMDYTVRAVLKPVSGFSVPGQSIESAAEFETEFQAATDDCPARWLLWIDAATADDLPRGRYATDAQFVTGADPVAITDPVFITLSESVSG